MPSLQTSKDEAKTELEELFQLLGDEFFFGAVQYFVELVLNAAEKEQASGKRYFSTKSEFLKTLPIVGVNKDGKKGDGKKGDGNKRKDPRSLFASRLVKETLTDSSGSKVSKIVVWDCSLEEFRKKRRVKTGDTQVGYLLLALVKYRARFPNNWYEELSVRAIHKCLRLLQRKRIGAGIKSKELYSVESLTVDDTRRLTLVGSMPWSQLNRGRFIEERVRGRGYEDTLEQFDLTLKQFKGIYLDFEAILEKYKNQPETWVELAQETFND